MKAAVIYENGVPDVLRYEDVPDPECPEGCVLIDVEAVSIEGGDLLARAGSPPPSVPHIVGYLAAGTVVAVGPGVKDVAVGFPLHVILSILGLPEEDFPRMLQLTTELFGGADDELSRSRDPQEHRCAATGRASTRWRCT